MKIIVGLGNPGEEYKKTRHNVGFMLVDQIYNDQCKMYNFSFNFVFEKKFNAEVCRVNNDLILVKPQTYMNDSGVAVAKIVKYYKLHDLHELVIIHDDLDIELGKHKVQFGGKSAGHHGIESIIEHLKTENFTRIRVGIGRPSRVDEKGCYYDITKNFLLSDFKEEELCLLSKPFDIINRSIFI